MDCAMEPDRADSTPQAQRRLLKSRLAYHHRCLREDATDPDLTSVERLALVLDRAKWVREIQRELDAVKGADSNREARSANGEGDG